MRDSKEAQDSFQMLSFSGISRFLISRYLKSKQVDIEGGRLTSQIAKM